MSITKAQSSRLRYRHMLIAESHLSSYVQLIPLSMYLHFSSNVSKGNQSIMRGTLGLNFGKTIKMGLIILERDQKC